MVRIVAVLTCFSVLALAGDELEQPRSIQSEISRLESKRFKDSLTLEEKTRLAEIYFLTSRCDDVRALVGAPKLLVCACGGTCAKNSVEEKVSKLRKLLESGARWSDKKTQVLWKSVQHSPEARYWAVKALRTRRDNRAVQVRADLEQSLDSLEVQSQ